jgi:hypothetical protein
MLPVNCGGVELELGYYLEEIWVSAHAIEDMILTLCGSMFS